MTDQQWYRFFKECSRLLGPGDRQSVHSDSWCAWTTFDQLSDSCHYWTAGLPLEADVAEAWITDGGVWGQPFHFSEIAHIILPKEFYWMKQGAEFEQGRKQQPVAELSAALVAADVPHRLTDLVLEIKLY